MRFAVETDAGLQDQIISSRDELHHEGVENVAADPLHWTTHRYHLAKYNGSTLSTMIKVWLKIHGAGVLHSSELSYFHKTVLFSSIVSAATDHQVYFLSPTPRNALAMLWGLSPRSPCLMLRYKTPVLVAYVTNNLPPNAALIVEDVITPYVMEMGGSLPESSPDLIMASDYSNLIQRVEASRPTQTQVADWTSTSLSQISSHATHTVHVFSGKERRQVSAEEIHIPSGTVVKVKRSRTVERSVDVNWRALGSMTIEAGIKQVISGSLVGELERMQGHRYLQRETTEHEVELNGNVSNQYKLIWVDVWRKGALELSQDNKTFFVPFHFHESTELQVVPRQNET